MLADDNETAEAAARAEISCDEVMQRLPQRYPFLFVDRATAYVQGKSIVGVKCVSVNEPYFQGHFPGAPVMPGVILIEAMAQTGGLLISKSYNLDPALHSILFMSVDNARFRRPVKPGEQIDMPVEVIFGRRNIFKFHGRCEVGGELAAECEFAALKVDR